MAHRSAGTVVTTHKATYIPPHLSPGYGGFLPALRHQYGETYGRATTRNFYTERARQVMLIPPHMSENAEKPQRVPTFECPYPGIPRIKRHSPPGQPPCLNKSYVSDDVYFTPEPKTERFGRNSTVLARSLNRDKVAKLDNMMRDCSEHRKAYQDITGLTPRVKFFVIPTEFGGRCLGRRNTKHESVMVSSASGFRSRSNKNDSLQINKRLYQSSNRERAMRDLHFEHR